MIALITELFSLVSKLLPFVSSPDPEKERVLLLQIQRRVSDEIARRELA